MAYREPTAGLLARIAELEHQLQEVRHEQTRAGTGVAGWLVGATLRAQVEQVLPMELETDQHDRLVEFLQRRFDAQGQFLAVGRSWHWSLMTAPSQRDLAVSVVVRDGTTIVRALERFKNLLGMCFVWVLLVTMPLLIVMPGLLRPGRLFPVALCLVLWLGFALCIRMSYAFIVRRRVGQLRATVQELARLSMGGY